MQSDKERRILEAAYGVFFRYGYARTTMGDLASAAGLSRPALYLVYPGKAEVFAAVVEWFIESTLAAMRDSLDEAWPLERKLLHVLEFAVAKPYDTVRSYPDAADLLSLDHAAMPAIEASFVKMRELLAELLRDAVAASALGVDAAELARGLMGAMRGFKLVATDGDDLRRLIALQVSLTVAALGAAEAAPAAKARPRPKARAR
jgi:AcrR family transcriptional regulator